MSQNRRMLTYIAIALIVGAAWRSPSRWRTAAPRARPAPPRGGADERPLPPSTRTTRARPRSPRPTRPRSSRCSTSSRARTRSSRSPRPGRRPRRRRARTRRAPRRRPTSSAKVKVDGTTYNVVQGDKVPGGSAAAFTITGVTSGDVTLQGHRRRARERRQVVLRQPRRGRPRDARLRRLLRHLRHLHRRQQRRRWQRRRHEPQHQRAQHHQPERRGAGDLRGRRQDVLGQEGGRRLQHLLGRDRGRWPST